MSLVREPISLEFTALTDCCRLWLDSVLQGALESGDLDWQAFGRLAFAHNLEPLLHHLRAEAHFPRDDVPTQLAERWENVYFENFVFNSRALEILAEIADCCRSRDLPVASVKGPVLLGRTFRDPAVRVMADLDLLCREQDVPAIIAIARQSGFTAGEESAVYHSSLRHSELDLLLELHFDLYDFLPDRHELLGDLLAAVEPIDCLDVTIPALPDDQERAFELAHLINHDLRVNLKPLLDLAAGSGTAPPSPTFSAVLDRWDLRLEYGLVERLLERLFGTGAEAVDHVSRPLASWIEPTIERIATIERAGQQQALQELASRQGLLAKIDYLSRLLLPPARRIGPLTDRERGSDAKGPRLAARWRHIRTTVQRGWRKLRSAGLASGGRAWSIKRQVYARRQR